MAAGGLGGGIAGAVSYRECNEKELFACLFHPKSRGDAFALGAILGGTTGGIIGIIVGYKHKSYRWERVPLGITLHWSQPHMERLAPAPVVTLRLSLGR